LLGDVRGGVLRGRGDCGRLCLKGRCEGEEDGKERNQFHGDTIAEDGIV